MLGKNKREGSRCSLQKRNHSDSTKATKVSSHIITPVSSPADMAQVKNVGREEVHSLCKSKNLDIRTVVYTKD